jgi:hypothetical protein
MSLLSLEKYLYDPRRRSEASAQTASVSSDFELSNRLMSSVGRSIFMGEALADLCDELEGLRAGLAADLQEQKILGIADRVDNLLQIFQKRLRQADQERSAEFKNVLDILNEAFAHLNSGNEKSDARLKHLETSLNSAAKMNDLQSLKSHLSKTLEYVREEAKRDVSEAQGTIDLLSVQIRQAHKATSRFSVQLPGRAEAIADMTATLKDQEAAATLHLALFAADSVRALRVRHGDEVANNLLWDLARKGIQPLAADGKVFGWSPHELLLTWHHADTAEPARDIPARLKSPFEHRAFVGTRTATFNVILRSIVMPARGSVDELVWALDRFSKGGSAS